MLMAVVVWMLVVVGLYEVHGRLRMNLSAVQFGLVVHYGSGVVVDYLDRLIYSDRSVRNSLDSYLDDLHVH